MLKTQHRCSDHLFDRYIDLVVAVYRQAMIDAKAGKLEAARFIQETVPQADPVT